MFLRLLLLFIFVPAIELAILIEIGKDIGFWPTMALIVLTGVIGSSLTRRQGLAVWNQFNSKLQTGTLPGQELIDGLIVLCSGALLLTPGIVTDFVGFLGLIPQSRALIRAQLQKYISRSQINASVGFNGFSVNNMHAQQNTSSPQEEWEGTPKEKPDYSSN